MSGITVKLEASKKVAVMSIGGAVMRLGTAIVDSILARLGEHEVKCCRRIQPGPTAPDPCWRVIEGLNGKSASTIFGEKRY